MAPFFIHGDRMLKKMQAKLGFVIITQNIYTRTDMLVAPSILSADFGHLARDVEAICEGGCDLVHVDVMDGHFVPNLTIGPVVVEAVAKAATKPLDIHLMVENNSFFVDLFAPLKPGFISFHIEEEKHPHRLIQKIRALGIKPAITLNPHTPPEAIEFLIEDVDMVLLCLSTLDLADRSSSLLLSKEHKDLKHSLKKETRTVL